MYKLDIPLDTKEAAAIKRRQFLEKERQNRIFNAKTRLIGVDTEALQQQVKDLSTQKETERARDESFMADMVRNDKITVLLQQRQENDIRNIEKSLNDFRVRYQQPETRREFDLSDPNSKKKDKPARVSDDDPRCGISSLQKFQGEDLSGKKRDLLQKEQRREWTIQQINEKENAKQQQKEADRLYDLKRVELDMRSMELENNERECRRRIEIANKNFNLNQVSFFNFKLFDSFLNQFREREQKEALEKQHEQEDNYTEIANQAFGDILTENPQMAISAFGVHRVITDRWKGMSKEQIDDIRETQEKQRKDNQRIKDEEALKNAEWDRQRVLAAKAGIVLEQRQERLRAQLRKEVDDANKSLNQEQKAQKRFLDKEVYINPPTAQYFMQFNTTSR